MRIRLRSLASRVRSSVHPSARTRLVALAFFVGALLGVASGATAATKIGPGVALAIEEDGGANVVIALASPATQGTATPTLASLKTSVANVQTSVLAQLAPSEFELRREFEAVPVLSGRIKSQDALERIAADPSVLAIDLDPSANVRLVDNVPHIGADFRHLIGNTGEGVVVAVLDSGLDTDHSNLGDDLLAEFCILDSNGIVDDIGGCPNGNEIQTGPGSAEDDNGHGSFVTGVITSNGAIGGVGVAPDARIVAGKVADSSGFIPFFSDVIAALDALIANPQLGVQIVNMSLGTDANFVGPCDDSSSFTMAAAAAVNTLRAQGVISFAATGNDGSSAAAELPACLANVVAVTASDLDDELALASNTGSETDVAAPGRNIVSSWLANGTAQATGTSIATAFASGCAALLIESGDAVTPDQIEARLKMSAVSVTDQQRGRSFPRIDCIADMGIADIGITKSNNGVTEAVPGLDDIPYTLVVTNAGPGTDPAVEVRDSFPAGLSCIWTSSPAGGAGGSAGAGTGDIDETISLPPGGEMTYEAICSIDPGRLGTMTNIALATASIPDPNPDNDRAMVEVLLTPEVDVSVTKAESADPVRTASGPSNLVYVIEITNAGPSFAHAVEVSELLIVPPGVVVDFIAPSQGFTIGDVWFAGTLEVGQTETLTVALSVGAGTVPGIDVVGDIATLVSVTGTDTDPSNDSDDEATTVVDRWGGCDRD